MPTLLSHSRTFPIAPDEAYREVLVLPLPQLFSRRYAAIAPITEVRDQTGDEWGSALGQSRLIVQGDGTRLQETLTRLDPPHAFGYTIAAVGGPIKALVGSADGLWAFEPVGTGTRVTWSWQVEPANAVASALMPVFGRMWEGFARQGFEQIEALLVR